SPACPACSKSSPRTASATPRSSRSPGAIGAAPWRAAGTKLEKGSFESYLSSMEITDPRALRAYAHPIRLKLVGLLRRSGPLTATQAGEKLRESAATCSFHLRQLAEYVLGD